jgi:transposase
VLLAALALPPHSARRRDELQQLYQQLQPQIRRLDDQVEAIASSRAAAGRLITHPGVGPVTALATEVYVGDPQRFRNARALASYVGLIPREYTSGLRQRLGALSKHGNTLLRFLWGEAAVHAARLDAGLQRFYRRKLVTKGLGKARAAVARKLGIRLWIWIMLRDEVDYPTFCRRRPSR